MDYAKKKNDELAALCKERGLAHTGKKADFVKRLEDHDATQTTSSTAAPSTSTAKPAIEDEIDWDDEPVTETAKAATSEQAASAIAAGGVGEVKNPVAVPNQTQVEDPAKTDDLTVAAVPSTEAPSTAAPVNGDAEAQPATTEEAAPAQPEVDFSQGIAERTIEEEIEKRKARALKFGMPEDSEDIKLLERAKRFGTSNDASKVPGMLNQALSTGRGERKRGREGGAGEEAGVRKRSRGRGRPGMGRRQGSERARNSPAPERKRNGGGNGNGGGGGPSWMSEADRAKAEARKARFAAPT